MLHLLREADPDNPSARITLKVLRRLYYLGLGPRPNDVFGPQKEFSTLRDFREEFGDKVGYSRGRFEAWTLKDFVNHAAAVERVVGGKPEFTDFERYARAHPGAPSRDIIQDRLAGGISELIEHLGYANARRWTEDDYLDFGVKFIEVNGKDLFGAAGIFALSAKRRGPGYGSIIRRFGLWDAYKDQVLQEYKERSSTLEQERAAKLARYRTMIGNQELPPEYGSLSDDQLLLYGGRFVLSVRVAPSMEVERRKSAAAATSHHYLKALLKAGAKHGLTAADVELEASILNVYDDLWPIDHHKTYLKVTPEEVTLAAARRAKAKRRKV
jgi:hypothetical protein